MKVEQEESEFKSIRLTLETKEEALSFFRALDTALDEYSDMPTDDRDILVKVYNMLHGKLSQYN